MSDCPAVIDINGVKYRKEEDRSANRVVLVVDRGWIFAGDLTVDDARGLICLDRAVWVFRWEGVGFDGVLANPKGGKVQIRKLPGERVEVPQGAEIFRVPVAADWGW